MKIAFINQDQVVGSADEAVKCLENPFFVFSRPFPVEVPTAEDVVYIVDKANKKRYVVVVRMVNRIHDFTDKDASFKYGVGVKILKEEQYP
jgi:hypothetical protein